ncbi:hypothetical protein FAI40_03670 [Acetobacteraceae bacterium]|nr:hypothetical protein FAI40_03670 [Acetobacteraceae bacterium]
MPQSARHKYLRHQLLEALEDVYPSPLPIDDVALSAPFDPYDEAVLCALQSLQEEGLTCDKSLLRDEKGSLLWHEPAITSRGIDHLASESNMSHTLQAGAQRVQQASLQPIIKEALLLNETLSMAEKKAYLEKTKSASEAELVEVAKELEAKGILKQSVSLF